MSTATNADRRRPTRLDDGTWLWRSYSRDGRSLRSIADELGCAPATVRGALVRHGIAVRVGGTRRPVLLDTRRWLRREYVLRGRSARSIAEELGCTPGVVLNALHRHHIPTRPARPVLSDLLQDRGVLVDRYCHRRQSITAIAEELGCSPGAVRRALHRHGIDARPLGAPRIEPLYDPAWLRRARARWSAAEIAARLECSEATVRSALWRSGIPAGAGAPRRPPELDDVAFLLHHYVQQCRTASAIAADLGCAGQTVLNALRRHGLAVRPASRGGPAAALPLRRRGESPSELGAGPAVGGEGTQAG